MEVKIIENTFIKLSDGTLLAARIWLPGEASEENKVPAILEFLPYRKRDVNAARDEINYTNFARNGYAGVRVDMRGCGDSTGVIQDEYVRQEQLDGLEVIDWIANQHWCTGSLGMMGISWGGFNSLQIAYERPKHLKAIIAVCFSDDRYSDDIHYKGGAMLIDNIGWAAEMEARNMLPPDPLISENWFRVWIDRLQTAPNLVATWLKHQTRDSYWKHASICEDYSRIEIPVFLIGGLADGYHDTVVRTLDNLSSSAKALIGPWVHLYPNIAVPEPRWGFCDEAVKWWDEHLKGLKPVNPAPKLTVFVEDVPNLRTNQTTVEGKWVTEPNSEVIDYYLCNGKLGEQRGSGKVDICTDETVGLAQGLFYPGSLQQMPRDQCEDDRLSVYFETEPFQKSTDFLGYVILKAAVSSSEPVASLFMRLCVVSPAEESRQIAYTGANLNHDASHQTFTAVEPGKFRKILSRIGYISETIRPGYKLRLCFSTAMFSMFLPNPKRTTLTLDLEQSQLEMPLLKSWQPYPYKVPAIGLEKPHPSTVEIPAAMSNDVIRNAEGEGVFMKVDDSGLVVLKDHGLGFRRRKVTQGKIHKQHPTSLNWSINITQQWQRKSEDWYVETFYNFELSCDVDNFYTKVTRKCQLNDKTVFEESHNDTVARNAI